MSLDALRYGGTCLEARERESAAAVRDALLASGIAPAAFREALMRIPPRARDAWVDDVLGTDALPPDGRDLPRGCAPYVPCSVDALLRILARADVREGDVFVDVGSGLGRAAMLAHLLTGAATVGVEIQRGLVDAARALAARAKLERCVFVHGDAVGAGPLPHGTVYFFYCPFSGERLERLYDALEPVARARSIRVGCVDLPPAAREWLEPLSDPERDVAVYRSTLHDGR